MIAAFGPWVTVADAVTRHTINGTNGGRHGTGCIIMAVIAAALTVPTLMLRRDWRALGVPILALGLAIATYGFRDSGSTVHHEQVYTEWGLWLTILGGASVAVGAVLVLLRR